MQTQWEWDGYSDGHEEGQLSMQRPFWVVSDWDKGDKALTVEFHLDTIGALCKIIGWYLVSVENLLPKGGSRRVHFLSVCFTSKVN